MNKEYGTFKDTYPDLTLSTIGEIKQEISGMHSKVIVEAVKELKSQDSRSFNLIIHGIKDKNDKQNDTVLLSSLIKVLGVNIKIKDHFRLKSNSKGLNRPLKCIFDSTNDVKLFFSKRDK